MAPARHDCRSQNCIEGALVPHFCQNRKTIMSAGTFICPMRKAYRWVAKLERLAAGPSGPTQARSRRRVVPEMGSREERLGYGEVRRSQTARDKHSGAGGRAIAAVCPATRFADPFCAGWKRHVTPSDKVTRRSQCRKGQVDLAKRGVGRDPNEEDVGKL